MTAIAARLNSLAVEKWRIFLALSRSVTVALVPTHDALNVCPRLPQRRTVAAVGLWLLLALASSGCGGTRGSRWWTVVTQAEPNPLVGQREYQLAPFLFDAINIEGRSEAEFASGPPEDVAAYQEGRRLLIEKFAEVLSSNHYHVTPLTMPAAPPGTFVIRAQPTYLRLSRVYRVAGSGFGMGGGGGSSVTYGTLTARVQIFTHDGRLVDDLRITAQTNRVSHQIEEEMRGMGDTLANLLRRYLDSRTGLQQP